TSENHKYDRQTQTPPPPTRTSRVSAPPQEPSQPSPPSADPGSCFAFLLLISARPRQSFTAARGSAATRFSCSPPPQPSNLNSSPAFPRHFAVLRSAHTRALFFFYYARISLFLWPASSLRIRQQIVLFYRLRFIPSRACSFFA